MTDTSGTAQDEHPLLVGLNPEQREAVRSEARLLGVVAGAGSGKTEVMSRRVAWWVDVAAVNRSQIIAFTFTEAAAEELKFRVRQKLQIIEPEGEEATLSGMYVGTIHAFCLKCLRDFAAAEYYNFDVLDDAGRMAMVTRGFWGVLAMKPFVDAARAAGAAATQNLAISLFLRSYDILNEHGVLSFEGPPELPPRIEGEREWCQQFTCSTPLGDDDLSVAFATSAARYYAYLRARRFLDFSTAQAEFVRKLQGDANFRSRFRETYSHMVVDEVQDINPAQLAIIEALVNDGGHLTAVGDHRQAIYSFRGGRVDLMGDLFASIQAAPDGHVQALPANYRSTRRIIEVANRWATSIGATPGLPSPAMTEGAVGRADSSPLHVTVTHFAARADEAAAIASTIHELVPPGEPAMGAKHGEGARERGISYSDVAILVRSATDISTYKDVLRQAGIPAVVRGGADLFSQVEVLAFLSALSLASGSEEFFGGAQNSSLPSRVQNTLGTAPRHKDIIPFALADLRARGLLVPDDAAQRLVSLAHMIHRRITEDGRLVAAPEIANVLNPEARQWLGSARKPRRLFPQTLFQWLLEEVSFGDWGNMEASEYETVRFHVGQLSNLLKGIEASGWTGPDQAFKYQLIGLMLWGAAAARTPEAPLLVAPNAVSITTIHSAKGLEFSAVFVADVCARRFPSSRAKTVPRFAFDSAAVPAVDPARLADNANNDDERRLMYVALTRAERFLFVSASGLQRSRFFNEIGAVAAAAGGTVANQPPALKGTIHLLPRAPRRDARLTTSFSDLRYYLECPQDFFIRKVLGFTPPIGQEFGYGRGVHNLLRAIHENPAPWAAMAQDGPALSAAVERLVEQGLFYLRHTVGTPYENLKNKAVRGVVDYVQTYRDELIRLEFEPEKAFETLFPEEGVLISGAIDVVRLDDPPRVTLIDFKSGNASGDNASGLSSEMMAMQLGVYGIAARKELEYEPDRGLVRYVGEEDATRREVDVSLDELELAQIRQQVVGTAQRIKERAFGTGPAAHLPERCGTCDFGRICPSPTARAGRAV
jgi:DNA helicase-2/ATP-dependent DNA helicase PcrA